MVIIFFAPSSPPLLIIDKWRFRIRKIATRLFLFRLMYTGYYGLILYLDVNLASYYEIIPDP